MPEIIAIRKITPFDSPKLKDAIAGPGHRPAKPQPTPKSTDPIISGWLISLLIRGGIAHPVKVFSRLLMIFQAKNIGMIAPPITKVRVGSQSPNISNHP